MPAVKTSRATPLIRSIHRMLWSQNHPSLLLQCGLILHKQAAAAAILTSSLLCQLAMMKTDSNLRSLRPCDQHALAELDAPLPKGR